MAGQPLTDLLPVVPCATCPWRKSSTVGGADIPGFSLSKIQALTCTAGPRRGEDGWRNIMACHYSPEGSERACIGYVAQEGLDNIWVRILAVTGRIDLGGILTACADLDLWPSFAKMLAAYELATEESEV